MKKLKALLRLLAVSLGLTVLPLNAASGLVSVPVVHGAWTFIGVPGFNSYSTGGGTGAITTWPTSISATSPIVIDAAGTISGTDYQVAGLEVPTWDGNVSNPVSTGTPAQAGAFESDGATPRPPTLPSALGSNAYGTIGLMVLGQSISGSHSSSTDHDGATIAGIAWTPKVQRHDSPVRTMYIRSANAAYPDIKVLYEAQYEGEKFFVQVETAATATTLTSTDNDSYQGVFSHNYTYDNAAVLGTDFPINNGTAASGASGNLVSGVLDAFDLALLDNNMTDTNIAPSSVTGSDRGKLDGNLTVLSWDATTQSWRVFRATGVAGTNPTEDSANDFSDLEIGKGYWVKFDKNGGADYNAPSGFVLAYNDAVDINHSTFIADGWNMMSFDDKFLSYSTTGIYVDVGAADDINITDAYGTTKIAFTTTAVGAADCVSINQLLDNNASHGYSNFGVRCVPVADTLTDFVLLSTRGFSIEGDAANTVARPLNDLTATITAEGGGNVYKAPFGIHTLIVQPNEFFFNGAGVDGNMSVQFPASTNTNPSYSPTRGVAATNALLQVAFDAASNDLSATNDIVHLDWDFSGAADENDTLLMASDYRFMVRDETLVRTFYYDRAIADANVSHGAYNQENNASLRIVGAANSDLAENVDGLVDDDLQTTVTNINTTTATTHVRALTLDQDVNSTFMIYYTGHLSTIAARIAKIDVQEQADGFDVLLETETANESNLTAAGAIRKVWQLSNVVNYLDVNASGGYDGNYSGFTGKQVTSDLKNVPAYAEDFPVSGPLYDIVTGYGKKPELIITGQTEAGAVTAGSSLGSFISWKQVDASKSPDEWYDNDDQFDLFWTEKENAYWVYLNGSSTNNLSFATPVISGTPYAHFNNYFKGTATTATTRNQLNHTLTVNVSNLTTFGSATSNISYFEVYANIGGNWTSLTRTGATNDFTIPMNSHETNGLSFDAGEVTVDITAALGSGQKVSTTYILDYEKPDITGVVMSGATAQVTINNGTTAASTIHVYNGDINDSSYAVTTAGLDSLGNSATNWVGNVAVSGDTTDVNLGALGLTFPSTFVGAGSTVDVNDSSTFDEYSEQLAAKLFADLRFTAVDTETLFSDQERALYLAVYAGSGILSTTSSTTWDSTPNIYSNTGELNTTYATDTGYADDGVQLKSAVEGQTTSCVYAHNNVALSESAVNTKTLAVGVTGLATIAYADEYIGQPLVCDFGGAIYVGAFIDGDVVPGDITMVPLSSQVATNVTITKQ